MNNSLFFNKKEQAFHAGRLLCIKSKTSNAYALTEAM